MKLIIDIPDYKLDEVQNGSIASNEILKAVRKGTPIEEVERPQGEFTDLERKVIADSINYLLCAELLEENGYTETVINALKSVLQKIGAEENHL